MNVDGKTYRSIWPAADGWSVEVIDQTKLPHEFAIARLTSLGEAADAIRRMVVRGAPLIGATAAYGICLALRENPDDVSLQAAGEALIATRPTAVNLAWAAGVLREEVGPRPEAERVAAAYRCAARICDDDVEMNRAIGRHGLALLRERWEHRRRDDRLNVLTHCNAGWLATVDWGTAMAPVYAAYNDGLPVHVWVDETRPRNQGASLTAWELQQHGVPHTVVVDNAGGHLMQQGLVDCCIVGTDRTTASGDVCNKIGTYLKALAADDNDIPFYVALPGPTIDWSIRDGLKGIPIEERDGREVRFVTGLVAKGGTQEVTTIPLGSPVANPAFDVTPARLISNFITERGVCAGGAEGLAGLYPDRARAGAREAP